jgi:hypothetical protein
MNPTAQHIQNHINISLAYANWWINYANTPANLNRIVGQSTGEKDEKGNYIYTNFTKEELINDAMNTALNHIRNATESNDILIGELNKKL